MLNLDMELTSPESNNSSSNKIINLPPSASLTETNVQNRIGNCGNRLTKRPSVDSGINMTSGQSTDSLPSLRFRNSKNSFGNNPKLSR